MKRILIASSQRPYHGGASTNSYALIKYFREKGIRSAGIFFDDTDHSIDPDGIGGVWRIKNSHNKILMKNFLIDYLGGDPDIILAKNYAAPVQSREMFKNIPIAYMVTGSPQMRKLSAEGISAKRYLKSRKIEKFEPEVRAVQYSDFVVPNSQIGQQLLYKHYGILDKITQPIDTSMALNGEKESKIFSQRQYEIAFIASNFNRTVKNAKFARKIFKSLPNYNKIVIGRNNEIFQGLQRTKIYNNLKHQDVLKILGDSKVVLCTSFYDASPNVIKEALLCDANILVSENCGWVENYPIKSVCRDVYNLNEWVRKIRLLTGNKLDYKLDVKNNNQIYFKIKELIG